MNDSDKLINDCKKFLGLAPYDSWANTCFNDPFFYEDIVKKYGIRNVIQTIKELNDLRRVNYEV